MDDKGWLAPAAITSILQLDLVMIKTCSLYYKHLKIPWVNSTAIWWFRHTNFGVFCIVTNNISLKAYDKDLIILYTLKNDTNSSVIIGLSSSRVFFSR